MLLLLLLRRASVHSMRDMQQGMHGTPGLMG